MRIGEFAQASGVPVERLRRYERLGLLEPASRDSYGYRRYAVERLPSATHLHRLVEAGLSPAAVKTLVDALEDPRIPLAVREARRATVAAYVEALRLDPTGGLLDLPPAP